MSDVVSSVLRVAAMLAIGLALGGCYYMQAASGQWEIVRKREPIEDVLADPDTAPVVADRLRLVQEARQFSIDELLLPDNDSYRSYADLEREYVLWNVFAAPEFSLRPKEWCFPVAGCVAYRGYFSREAAYRKAARLEGQGYDVAVGGVAAYSTLGHFDDPVLNTMLGWDDIRLVAVLFHELAHQQLYVKGDSAFNESFATAVEEFGVVRWLNSRGEAQDIRRYQDRRALRQALMSTVAEARNQLATIYGSSTDDEDKRQQKRKRLQQLSQDIAALIESYGGDGDDWRGSELNNARLASMTLYEGRLPAFRALLAECSDELRCFYEKARALAEQERQVRDDALDDLAGREL